MRLSFHRILLAVLLLALPHAASAETLPEGFVRDTVVSGLDNPVAFDAAPDGRLYIAQKGGVVRVFENGGLRSEPFLDLSHEVCNYSDRGLADIVLHPEFPSVPHVYLLYVYDHPGASPDSGGPRTSRLLRVSADPQNPAVALPGSEMLLLGGSSVAAHAQASPTCRTETDYVEDCVPADQRWHTVGGLGFHPDGSLFVSIGDSFENTFSPETVRVQDLDSLSGKLLRINPLTGDAYPDNPFFDGSFTSNRSKVYAYGLRNPWRLAVDPVSGEPFVGDVGLTSWEEINVGRGANFGWPCYEGGLQTNVVQPGFSDLPECQSLYQSASTVSAPLHAWGRSGTSGAAIGGDFYTGAGYPEPYRNAYFFGDYSQRWIRYLTFDEQGAVTAHDFGSSLYGIVQLRIGPDTNLYYVSLSDNSIYRLRYVEGNTPPVARAEAAPLAGDPPLTVQFSGSESFDPDGDDLSYSWSFGDGAASTLPVVSHVYGSAGRYEARLTVTDTGGESASATTEILVGQTRPQALIRHPQPGSTYSVSDRVTYAGAGFDAEDGPLDWAALEWEVVIHHDDHLHYDYFRANGPGGEFEYLDHDDDTYLELCLTVTDSTGLSDRACVDVLPRLVQYTFDSIPSDLEISYQGVLRRTPFTQAIQAGGRRFLSAPRQPEGLLFHRWSNGGDRSQLFTAGSVDETFVASFGPYETQGGLDATYYANEDFTGSTMTRVDPRIDFDWGYDGPAPGIGPDYFSVRWSGFVVPDFTENYTFRTVTDNGARLWLDGKILFDDWRHSAPHPNVNEAQENLIAGRPYALTLEMYEAWSEASAKFYWSSASVSERLIPSENLLSSTAGEHCRGGIDEDDDGFVDCDDPDCATSAGPGTVSDVRWTVGGFEWNSLAGAERYDVVRADLREAGGDERCVGEELPLARWIDDGELPEAGKGFLYLVRGEGAPCAPGDFGTTSAGAVRDHDACD